MVTDQKNIYEFGKKFPANNKQNVEKHMKGVLRNHQGIQKVALINRVFIIGLKLVECNNLEKKSMEHENIVNHYIKR